MTLLLSFLWFVRTIKTIFFWIYLWQLKEYHIGRFLDHFQTYKGKQLLMSYLQFLKIFLVSGFFLFPSVFPFVLIFIYIGESAIFLKNFLQKRLIKPVLTKKTTLISGVLIVLTIVFLVLFSQNIKSLAWLALWFLIFDILLPIIISLIILIFQPLAVLVRYQTIRKAKQKRESFEDLLVIGITGSYGKTSTKEFLYQILSEKYNVLKTEAHQNSEVGISQCILNDLNEEYQVFICEMGAYNKGGIKFLCDIAKPKIGILTGINEQHMATFGSQENIIRAKFELIEALPAKGLAILNTGDPKIQNEKLKIQNYNSKLKSLRFYSTKEQTDLWAEEIRAEKELISFNVVSKDGDQAEFKVNLMGVQNVENILGAVCCAKELGMSLKEITRACEKIQPEQGAMKLLKGKNGLNVIDATYSANPDGVISALDYLKIWPGKKVIIMPCLIELGRASKEVHKRIGKKIGEVCDLAIITTKDRYKEIREAALDAGMTEIDIFYLDNPKEIYDKIKAFCRAGDVVLLESRVPKELIKQLTINN